MRLRRQARPQRGGELPQNRSAHDRRPTYPQRGGRQALAQPHAARRPTTVGKTSVALAAGFF